MKLARTLLAATAIALLAACDSDPVAPTAKPDGHRSRNILVTPDTTSIEAEDQNLDNVTDDNALPCVLTTVTVGGVTTTVKTCDGRGPAIGSGN